jgi:hypothetical protein
MKSDKRGRTICGFLRAVLRSKSKTGDMTVLDDVLHERGDDKAVTDRELARHGKKLGLRIRHVFLNHLPDEFTVEEE